MLTEKVVFCIVMVPILWLTYGALLYCFSSLDGPAIALAIFSMPLFAYLGVVVAEAGMIDWKELRVYLMRVFPSTRRRMAALPQTQRTLQKDLREFIKAIGPGLGEIYYGKDVDWATIRQKSQLEKKVD
jgi:glycerol-3-phosphate O-acyltransferase/dihydroxyacetone phosphate acyltransferase